MREVHVAGFLLFEVLQYPLKVISFAFWPLTTPPLYMARPPHVAFETLCGWRTETGSLLRVFECLQEKNSYWGVLFIWEIV